MRRPTPSRSARRNLGALVLVAALVATAVVVPSGPATARGSQGDGSTTTTTAGRSSAQASSKPTGAVAYVTEDGRVWAGTGNGAPVQVGDGAALGAARQAAVAVSPSADAVAWVRTDGSLAIVGIDGGAPTVVATDVAVSAVGAEPVIAWSSTGDQLAYVAVGTPADVRPRTGAPRAPSAGSFIVPLPQGVIGNTIRTVTRNGTSTGVIGDPSMRSFIGVNWSPSDPFLMFDSVVPGTSQRYTLAAGSPGNPDELATPLSADDPDFAPDGSFLVAVGPAKGQRELQRINLDSLDHTALVQDDSICNPAVSPDATRIVYAGGTNCNRLMVISSKGGQAFDITPGDTPDTADFGAADIGWTADGRWITYPGCRFQAGRALCGGPTSFLEPDTGRQLDGPEATTIAPVRRPLVQDIYLDVYMRGPLEFRHSFLISPETQAGLTDKGEGKGFAEAKMTDGNVSMSLKLTAAHNAFVTGTMTVVDPDNGIDRTFMVIARATLLGVRIFSLTGTWYSTSDLPFASGRLNMAVRRR